MNFLSKKARLGLVAKTLIVTSILGTGSYIMLNDATVTAYATTTTSNKELVKAKILNDLLTYKTDITFTTDEYTAYSIGTDSTADPQQAYFEVLYEHPEIFWTAQSVLGVTNTDGTGKKSYTLYVNNLYSDSEISTKKAELDSKINDIVSKFSSYDDLRKVYEIHDYVNANVIYNHTLANATAPDSSIDPNTDLSGYIADIRQITKNNANFFEVHSLYGAVVNGDAVCEGYAKFANILLTKSGVEAKLIVSATHAWNYVKVNGNYYQLDTTWDDRVDNKTLSPYKYFNITNTEMLQDTPENKTLHNATSYVPNCTDTTFDNIFRSVVSGKITGKNVMRVDDKLYYLDDSTGTIYSYNLDGTNQGIIRNPKGDDLLIFNLMAYDGNLYYLSYKVDATYTYLMEINKIDLSTGIDSPALNINNGFGLTNGSLPNIDFYIDNNNFVVTSDGTTKKFLISTIKASGISISGTNSISTKGGTTQLTATVAPNNTTDKTVTWSSSDESIATVDSNGLVTAKADGNVDIKATSNDGSGISSTKTISISGQTVVTPPTDVKVTGITISGTDTITTKSGTTQLSATVTPNDSTDKTVTWSSNDESIATVDSNGLVTAKTDGSVDIKATANDGSGISLTKTITISGQTVVTPPTDIKVTGITISGGNNISTKGGTLTLTTDVNPSNATDKTVTWSSSDDTIATVDSNGVVTAKADGSVDIKVTSNDGSNISSTKTISVSGQTVVTPPTDVKVTGITISGGSNISTKGGTLTLTTDVNPSNATDKTVTWSSSDNTVATVDSNGVVTAKADGNVDIKATTNDGSGIKATKTITISGQTVVTPPTDVKVTGITITGGNNISTKGGTLTLIAVVNPSDATNKAITWSSSDTSIATVNSSGVVTAINNGSVAIKATASDGSGIVATKNITVTGQVAVSTNVKITGINITGNDSISSKGGNLTLTCNVTPSTATDKTVTWSSSNTSIANISSSGVVTAIANGTVTIIATSNDGSGIKGTKTITITGQTTTTSSHSVLKSVSISGTEEVGHKLKAKIKYDGVEPDVEYQWQRASKKDGDYTDISGADDEEYKLKSSDKGKYIKVVVIATINGTSYDVEDITSKIDKDTSSDDEEDDNSSSSSSSNSNDTVVFRPSTSNSSSMGPVIPTGESPAGKGIMTANSSSPANGQFTNPSGHPVSGWVSVDGNWYYLDSNGYVKTGWVNESGKWYYLNPNVGSMHGTMKTGWIQDDGRWYYLYTDGSMASNTTIDGYRLDADGVLIE